MENEFSEQWKLDRTLARYEDVCNADELVDCLESDLEAYFHGMPPEKLRELLAEIGAKHPAAKLIREELDDRVEETEGNSAL